MTSDTAPADLCALLARFGADAALHARFPDSALKSAELAIADTVGCILAGVHDPAVVKLGRTIPDEAAGPSRRSSSLRHAHPVSARDAAAVNGCAAHARELDDNVLPAAIHSSAVLTPALFALGEECGASGIEVLRAFIVGMEVNARIGQLVGQRHYECGWHTISTIGMLGTAAACATLLKLDAGRIGHAISLAFSMAAGSKLQFGSEAKPMHSGFAAAGGIWAAQLAREGFQGHREVLQGKWSFHELYAGTPRDGRFMPALFPSAPLAIDEYPPVAKLYPCCGSAHLGIGALRELRANHAFELDDIERIDVHMPRVMTENVRYGVPANEMEARFSMPYCAAVTLVHGLPRLPHFSPEAVARPHPQVARLMPLVHKHVRQPSPEVLAKKLIFVGDCLVEIRLKDGTLLSAIAEHPKGCADNPLTAEERRTKFFDCAGEYLAPERTPGLFAALLDLRHAGTIAGLAQVFRQW